MTNAYNDVLAAQIFVVPLDQATKDSMKRMLLRKASSGLPKPPSLTTRDGLAFLAFTTVDDLLADATEEELDTAIERVSVLWTAEERERFDRTIAGS